MKIAKAVALAGLLAMTWALLNGFFNGSFTEDGAQLLSNPWGIVSIVDLYTGFSLIAIWIFFRENSRFNAVLWIVMVMLLGFWAASLYVILNLFKYEEDWAGFWMGARANG